MSVLIIFILLIFIRVEFRENVRAFFSQGQTKLSVTMNCPYYAGFRRAGLTVLLEGMNKQLY